jgi:cytochrome c peroxidase
LPAAVRIMARVQLDKTLSNQDMGAIVTLLRSLTGKLPDDLATAPILSLGVDLTFPALGKRGIEK